MSDYIPDYTDLHAEHEREQERRLEQYPKCDHCREPITDEKFYNIDGTFYHKECLDSEYLKDTEDYMEE